MKRRRLLIGLSVLFLGFAGSFVAYRKWTQRDLVAELLKGEFTAVQFSDGKYCESIEDLQNRNWLWDTADVVYFDVPHGSVVEALAHLRQLSSLTRVIVRYQGDDFEQFSLQRVEIEERIASERALIQAALPDVEVWSCWTVAEFDDAG